MFWHKKDTQTVSPALFFFIGAGVLVTVGLFLLYGYDRNVGPSTREAPVIVEKTPVEVLANYRNALHEAQDAIGTIAVTSALFEKLESVFFSVHVPKEFLTVHLETVLAIQKLKGQWSAATDDAIRAQVLQAFATLVARVGPYHIN